MGSGAPDAGSNTRYDGAPGSNPIDDPMKGGSMYYGGATINMNDPANFSPDMLNKSASPYISDINNLKSQFENSAAGSAFNPEFYKGMMDTSSANLESHLNNQYAAMGLSGSSAEAGAMSNALTNNQMSWMNRQQGDQLKAMSGIEGLDQTGLKDTMGVQAQYGEFQDAYNQSIANLLGLQNQAQASSNQETGQIIAGAGQMGASAAMIASDFHLKKDVHPITESLEKLKQINGVQWKWKRERGEPGIGVIAQDVQKVFPDAVRRSPEGHLEVAYANLVGPLVEAVKDLSTQLEKAMQRIETLEAK